MWNCSKWWLRRIKRELIYAWGVPVRSYSVDNNLKFLTFRDDRTLYIPGGPSTSYTNFYGNSMTTTTYGNNAPTTLGLTCETTFGIRYGLVVSYRYEGNNCVTNETPPQMWKLYDFIHYIPLFRTIQDSGAALATPLFFATTRCYSGFFARQTTLAMLRFCSFPEYKNKFLIFPILYSWENENFFYPISIWIGFLFSSAILYTVLSFVIRGSLVQVRQLAPELPRSPAVFYLIIQKTSPGGDEMKGSEHI